MASISLNTIKHHFQKAINIYHYLVGCLFVVLNGYPSQGLTIIGVTGTDGKTTTSHLIYEFLKQNGIKVALISTVNAVIGGQKIETGFHVTSPDARTLQPLFRKIKDLGFTHVVIEVTSHGLDQNRFVGIGFETAVLTNITPEHLDYHHTLAGYKKAKSKLFREVKYAILNQDDPSFSYFKKNTKSEAIIPYTKSRTKKVSHSLLGTYNLYNIAAATAAAKIYGVTDKVIDSVIKTFPGVPGRREEISLGQNFKVIVDFAHTPNALNLLLTQLRKELPKGGKIILVFGCAGLRDHQKRPLMGEIANKLANMAIITTEDPRTENVDDIYIQITSNLNPINRKIVREDNRQKAIKLAINLARPKDIVIITGKGHEKSICFGNIEYPWSDKKAAIASIRQILGPTR